MTTTLHRYPLHAVVRDYAASAGGLAVTAMPLGLLNPAPGVAAVLGVVSLIFLAHGVRAGLKHETRIEVSEQGISRHGLRPIRIDWRDISDVRLRYYSTRRDRSGGWMQLTVKGDGRRLAAESTISGFDRIVDRVARAAASQSVRPDRASVENFAAFDRSLPSLLGREAS